LAAVFATAGEPTTDVTAEGKQDMTDGFGYGVFCRTGPDEYRHVVSHGPEGVVVLPGIFSFNEVWNDDLAASASVGLGKLEAISWSELINPLPDPQIDVWGYAMTYPEHRDEVQLNQSFYFRKFSNTVSANDDIVFRPYLDYEAEVALLMERGRSDRFGYLLANDLTDRGIQARTFDPENMGPGFSKAKSFEGALHVGLLLVVSNGELWEELEIELSVNGERRQHLIARDSFVRPGRIHTEIFSEDEAGGWALAATGTTGGVQFQSPTVLQKVGLIVAAGFSKEEATERWLEQLSFLKPADTVEFKSTILGRSSATIVDN
ncbi:MAG: fumarylacetoacetate hydrolase family protein, partial [Thermodesulfobacteriota bacterium]